MFKAENMFRLVILFCFIISNSAKVFDLIESNNDNTVDGFVVEDNFYITVDDEEPLWALNLNNDLDSLKLRAGSEEEIEEFYYYAGPMISRYERSHSSTVRVKKDDPGYPDEPSKDATKYPINEEIIIDSEVPKKINYSDIKTEIFKIINKFILTSNDDPNPSLSEGDEEEPFINLYFKGPYTSLMVILGEKQWHYFIRAPSPLPIWFYEEHNDVKNDEKRTYVDLPDDVKEVFYEKLLHMLQMFLSFPV